MSGTVGRSRKWYADSPSSFSPDSSEYGYCDDIVARRAGGAYMAAETVKWAKEIKLANIKVD